MFRTKIFLNVKPGLKYANYRLVHMIEIKNFLCKVDLIFYRLVGNLDSISKYFT